MTTNRFLGTTNSFLSIVIIGLAFTAAGCKTANSDSEISSGEIEATIDGKAWKGQGGTAVKQTITTGAGKVTVATVAAAKVLNNSTGESETLEVIIYGELGAEDISKRSYDIDSDNMPKAQIAFITMIEGQRVYYAASEGTVKIDGISEDNVKGTFEGTLANVLDKSDTKKVTGGGFNVDFSYTVSF